MPLVVGIPGVMPCAVTPSGDSEAPTITALTVSNGYDSTHGASTTLLISGITLTATDNVGVTGYLINESATPPAAEDVDIFPAPTTYTATGAASKYAHLYAWARDAAGNVSEAAEAYVLCLITTHAGAFTLNAVPSAGVYDVTFSYGAGASGWTAAEFSDLAAINNETLSRVDIGSGVYAAQSEDGDGVNRGVRWTQAISIKSASYAFYTTKTEPTLRINANVAGTWNGNPDWVAAGLVANVDWAVGIWDDGSEIGWTELTTPIAELTWRTLNLTGVTATTATASITGDHNYAGTITQSLNYLYVFLTCKYGWVLRIGVFTATGTIQV